MARTFEDSVVDSDLRRWGFWCGLQYAADGHSPINTLKQILSGRGNNPEHKILVIDPPERVRFWEKNARVLMLRREYYEALVAYYCLPMKKDGHPYRASELGEFLGIKPEAYLDRLARGRRGYKSLLFPDLVLSRAAC